MNWPRSPLHLAPILAIVPILLAGCDGSSPTEAEAGPSPLAATWQGTTVQAQSVTFTVGGTAQAPALTSIDLTVVLDELTPGPGGLICLGATIGVSATPVSIPIIDNRFVVRIPGDLGVAVSPPGASLRFEGVFASTTAASGRLEAQAPESLFGCAGSGSTGWTAQRS